MIKLHEGEKIIAEVPRHWLPLVARGILFSMFALAPFAAEALLAGISSSAAEILSRYGAHIIALEASWALIMWMMFAVEWTNHYLDVLIVTDRRILDVDQIGLFARDIAELRVDNIEDIRIEVIGFLAHWLDFGTIELQTAAESRSFDIKNIVRPTETRAIISKMRDDYHRRMEGVN